LARALAPAFVGRLLEALRLCHRYVVLDLGDLGLSSLLARPDSGDARSSATGAALEAAGAADLLLLVTGGDLVSAARARDTLLRLGARPGWDAGRVALVVNRHDPAYHFERWQLEATLGVGTAAVVPFDHGGVQRALAARRPVALDGRSRAGRALLDLADRLHGGAARLPRAETPSLSGTGAGPATPRALGAGLRPGGVEVWRRLAAAVRAAAGRAGAAPAVRPSRAAPTPGADADGPPPAGAAGATEGEEAGAVGDATGGDG
jgi:hypothetical protein